MKRPSVRATRFAHSVMELMVCMFAASLLLLCLSSTLWIATRATDRSKSPAVSTIEGSAQLAELLGELQFATAISEQSAKAVTISVADRNNDGAQESIRYAWSGTAGAPLLRTYNQGSPLSVLDNVHAFQLQFESVNRLSNGNFDVNLTPWTGSAASIQYETSPAYQGAGCLRVKSRNDALAGPQCNVTALISQGKSQRISLWLQAKDKSEPFTIGVKVTSSTGIQTFSYRQTAAKSSWLQFSGSVTPTWTGTLQLATLFIDTSPSGSKQDFWIDEVWLPKTQYAQVRLQHGANGLAGVDTGFSFLNRP